MKCKKQQILFSLTIVAGLLLITIGTINIKRDKEIKFREQEIISSIITEDTHYIDKSLINVPINVPYTTNSNSENKNNVTIISDNPDIIKVNDDNTITALKIGEANLTLIAKENEEITAGLHIIVE